MFVFIFSLSFSCSVLASISCDIAKGVPSFVLYCRYCCKRVRRTPTRTAMMLLTVFHSAGNIGQLSETFISGRKTHCSFYCRVSPNGA